MWFRPRVLQRKCARNVFKPQTRHSLSPFLEKSYHASLFHLMYVPLNDVSTHPHTLVFGFVPADKRIATKLTVFVECHAASSARRSLSRRSFSSQNLLCRSHWRARFNEVNTDPAVITANKER
jgi:hypothetical protein